MGCRLTLSSRHAGQPSLPAIQSAPPYPASVCPPYHTAPLPPQAGHSASRSAAKLSPVRRRVISSSPSDVKPCKVVLTRSCFKASFSPSSTMLLLSSSGMSMRSMMTMPPVRTSGAIAARPRQHRLTVDVHHRALRAAACGVAGRVDVDHRHGFAGVDDQRAAVFIYTLTAHRLYRLSAPGRAKRMLAEGQGMSPSTCRLLSLVRHLSARPSSLRSGR